MSCDLDVPVVDTFQYAGSCIVVLCSSFQYYICHFIKDVTFCAILPYVTRLSQRTSQHQNINSTDLIQVCLKNNRSIHFVVLPHSCHISLMKHLQQCIYMIHIFKVCNWDTHCMCIYLFIIMNSIKQHLEETKVWSKSHKKAKEQHKMKTKLEMCTCFGCKN
jgi:hypothetical protein